MAVLNARGLTLIEAVLALLLLAIAVVSILPAFLTQVQADTRNEIRSGAVTAAQARLEALRLDPPSSLPDSGSTAPQLFTIDGREFRVITFFCERAEFCSADGSRHLRVEVRHDDRLIYDVETVFTELL